jgi:hypothetical protein
MDGTIVGAAVGGAVVRSFVSGMCPFGDLVTAHSVVSSLVLGSKVFPEKLKRNSLHLCIKPVWNVRFVVVCVTV